MADVFISYKREERARVVRIAEALQALGLSVWFDASLEGGHSFHAQINQEARAAKCVLVCWTPAAAHSEWVIGEAEIGRTRGVLAPVFLAPTDLPPPFNTIHAFDLTSWNGDQGDGAWLGLLDRVGSLVGRAGLRHVALALAAGEPVRTAGANAALTLRAAPPPRASQRKPLFGKTPPREMDPVPLRRSAWGLAVATTIVLIFGLFVDGDGDGDFLFRLWGPALLMGAAAGLAFMVLGRRRLTVMSVLLALTAAGPAFLGVLAGFSTHYVLNVGWNVGPGWAGFILAPAFALAGGCGYSYWLGRHLRRRAEEGRRGISAAGIGFGLVYVLIGAAIWGAIDRSIDAPEDFALFWLVLTLAGAAFHIAGRERFRVWSLLAALVVAALSALLTAYGASVLVSLLAHRQLEFSHYAYGSSEHLALQLLGGTLSFCFASYRIGLFQAARAADDS